MYAVSFHMVEQGFKNSLSERSLVTVYNHRSESEWSKSHEKSDQGDVKRSRGVCTCFVQVATAACNRFG